MIGGVLLGIGLLVRRGIGECFHGFGGGFGLKQARMLQPLKPADRKTLLALLTQLVDLNNEASRVPLRAEDALEHLGKSN